MSLKKSQILKFGPRVHELVKQNVNFSTLNKQTLKFLLSCISCLINNHPFFALKDGEKAAVKEIMLPYKKYFVTIANPNQKNNVLTAVKKTNRSRRDFIKFNRVCYTFNFYYINKNYKIGILPIFILS